MLIAVPSMSTHASRQSRTIDIATAYKKLSRLRTAACQLGIVRASPSAATNPKLKAHLSTRKEQQGIVFDTFWDPLRCVFSRAAHNAGQNAGGSQPWASPPSSSASL